MNDSEFTISSFSPTFQSIFIPSSPTGISKYLKRKKSSYKIYDLIGCSFIDYYSLNYGINYNVEFIVEKVLDGSISGYNGVLCTKIKLTNTSIHFSDCPECFEWSISGSIFRCNY